MPPFELAGGLSSTAFCTGMRGDHGRFFCLISCFTLVEDCQASNLCCNLEASQTWQPLSLLWMQHGCNCRGNMAGILKEKQLTNMDKSSSKSPKLIAKSFVSSDCIWTHVPNAPQGDQAYVQPMPQHGCFLAEDVRMGPDSLDQGYEGSTSSPLPKVRMPHHLTEKFPSSFPILPSFPRMGLKDRTAGIPRFLQL